GLKKAIGEIQEIKEDFKKDVNVPGSAGSLNDSLEKAGRVKDFIELGELMARDALNRNESCGGHFREEYQTEDGEAKRDDANYAYVAAWEYKGDNTPQELHKEELKFDVVHPSQRSYK
ncbi:MAG TPA: fumarate reductase/succinate dehydrogenase flavoprotein subunit, partial [Turneriella sp.]|nr:fumarate reductase/succinate dehydrogenase flavoprotein subunit [Turneriella sp.]